MADEVFFQLKPEHIKLLSSCYVRWNDCETGAPEIDPKRPYGNSGSQIWFDMAEILGETIKCCPHCDEPLDDFNIEKYEKLHRELEQALQIILSTKTFFPGKYIRIGEYPTKWMLK